MKINKKGFTLVELLAVIALLALLTGIAVPNIISTINNNKRQTFLVDAKRMISKAQNLLSSNKTDRDNIKTSTSNYQIVYNFSRLNSKGEFATDSDGSSYSNTSYVKITYSPTTKKYSYCICVIGSKRRIGNATSSCNYTTNDCILSENLSGIDVVKDK